MIKTRTLKIIAGISAAIALLGVLFLFFTQPDRCPHYYCHSEPVCVFCGSSCSHDFEQGTCRVCGYTCLHTWENGWCSTCGMECGHSFEQGVCSLCGESCAHHWSDGACEICGLECGHQWKEGSCTVCSLNCSHRWQKGVCEICGVECMHPTHTKEEDVFTAPVCTQCGETAVHRWVYGQCTICGAGFQFVERQLPDSFVKESAAAGKGKVETVSYQSHFYGQDGAECTKRMTVYTPYGYSPEQEYDLMLFCVGSNGASTLYFSDP
ncbi:MAG: hypothetical protein MJ135_05005, partial [Oscillospiraceae bacterium]|nr:hypothetical protein [Oscillospiraceae bacterium]